MCRLLRAAHSKQQTILRLTLASMLLLTYQSWQLKSLVQSSLSLSLHLVYNCVSIFCQGASYFNGERHDQLFFSSSCRRRRLCFCIFRCAQLLFLSLPVGVTCWPEAAGVTVCYHITSLCSKNIGVAAETSSIRAAIIVVTTCSWPWRAVTSTFYFHTCRETSECIRSVVWIAAVWLRCISACSVFICVSTFISKVTWTSCDFVLFVCLCVRLQKRSRTCGVDVPPVSLSSVFQKWFLSSSVVH